MSINDNIRFLENIKQGFKIKIPCGKYRCETITQPKSNNLDYMTNPTFRNVNCFLVLSFKNSDNNLGRNYYDNHYTPLAKIKDFNLLIGNKMFFDQPVKNNQEAHEKLVEYQK